MLVSSMEQTTPSGPRSITTPSSSSRSAEPQAEDAAVAGFDPHARARYHKCGDGRDVEGVRSVATGTAGVDQRPRLALGVDGDRLRERQHRAHQCGELDRRLALGAHQHRERLTSASVADPLRIVAIAASAVPVQGLPPRERASTSGHSNVASATGIVVPPQTVIEDALRDEPELHLARSFHDGQLLGVAVDTTIGWSCMYPAAPSICSAWLLTFTASSVA